MHKKGIAFCKLIKNFLVVGAALYHSIRQNKKPRFQRIKRDSFYAEHDQNLAKN